MGLLSGTTNFDSLEKILRPIKLVERKGYQDLLYEDEEKIVELWNKLEEARDFFDENDPCGVDSDTHKHIESRFALASLKVATSLYKHGSYPNITKRFNETELNLFEIIEDFRFFDDLSADEIKDKISRQDGQVYEMVKKYSEKMVNHTDNIFENPEIKPRIARGIKILLNERTQKIQAGVIAYIDTSMIRAVQSENSTTVRKCSECGSTVPAEASFYNQCGTKLTDGGKNQVNLADKSDCVNFTLTAPSTMSPGCDYEIGVWAYIKEQEQEMIEAAKNLHKIDNISLKSKKSVPVNRESYISVFLDIPDFEIDDSQNTIYWNGEVANATFMINVPQNLPLGQYKGKLLFLVEGLQIARLDFRLSVGVEDKGVSKIPANLLLINRAFASYSSEDRDEVLGRIQGIQKILPNFDVFIDLISLHSGEKWYERIKEEIKNRDIFYLFWSEAASKSQWVEKEWKFALEWKGIPFISPVPLVSPKTVKPPEELASLHFNDWMLAYMSKH